jgi:hypothetical protein
MDKIEKELKEFRRREWWLDHAAASLFVAIATFIIGIFGEITLLYTSAVLIWCSYFCSKMSESRSS